MRMKKYHHHHCKLPPLPPTCHVLVHSAAVGSKTHCHIKAFSWNSVIVPPMLSLSTEKHEIKGILTFTGYYLYSQSSQLYKGNNYQNPSFKEGEPRSRDEKLLARIHRSIWLASVAHVVISGRILKCLRTSSVWVLFSQGSLLCCWFLKGYSCCSY